MKRLSPLAETLFAQLNRFSHVFDPYFAAIALSTDDEVSPAKRKAYREIYEYLAN